MQTPKRKTFPVLAKRPNYAEPRSNDEKRISPRNVKLGNNHGDMQSVSLSLIGTEIIDNTRPKHLGSKLVSYHKTNPKTGEPLFDDDGKRIMVEINLGDEWSKEGVKICRGCHMAVPDGHYVLILSQARLLLDMLLDETTAWTVYHKDDVDDCEPTSAVYKFMLEQGAITRLVKNGGENSYRPGKPEQRG